MKRSKIYAIQKSFGQIMSYCQTEREPPFGQVTANNEIKQRKALFGQVTVIIKTKSTTFFWLRYTHLRGVIVIVWHKVAPHRLTKLL